MKKNQSTVILLLLLVIILAVLCTLFATGKIKFADLKNESKKETTEKQEDNKLSETEAISQGNKLYKKANKVYSVWKLLPYCGYDLIEIYNQTGVKLDSNNSYIEYYESKYSSVEDLKKDLSNFLSTEIINAKISEDNDTFYKVNNNKLYCRKTLGNGWVTPYLNKYDLKINTIEEKKITYTVTSYYAIDFTKCKNSSNNMSVSDCEESNIETKNTNFTIEKVNNNWVVTSFTLHD